MVEQGRPHMTIWRKRIACWIPKPTNTQSGYVILDIKYHAFLSPFALHTPHRSFEDGPDRGFRNVGKTQTDAGEIPKKTYTRLRNTYFFSTATMVTRTCLNVTLYSAFGKSLCT
jgi:hypothetical protein